jgi:hypothetical protein
MNPIVLAPVLMVVLGVAVCLTGSGLFFSAASRKASTAAVLTIAFCLLIWGAVPFAIWIGQGSCPTALLYGHPILLLCLLAFGTSGAAMASPAAGRLPFVGWTGSFGNAEMMAAAFILMALHALVGFAFAGMAAERTRRSLEWPR